MTVNSGFTSPFFAMLVNHKTNQPFCTFKKPGKYSVGRKSSQKASDVQLNVEDVYFSGQHFVIQMTEKKEVILRDNNSVNGTFWLNKQAKQFIRLKKDEEVLLANGDVFKAGTTEFLVKIPVTRAQGQPNETHKPNKTTIIRLPK